MTKWETEDEDECAASLPAKPPTMRQSSRSLKTSRRRSRTPPTRSMSPNFVDKATKPSSRDITTDESISILDPRRFTPTLHASLVSEILTLRRDQDEKISLIESLEASLFSSKQDYDSLHKIHVEISKESRSIKRQLSLLEGGTSNALTELARERDEAVESAAEIKKRLDNAQKKIRCQEDDSQRVHDQWARERDDWENERRQLERKLHVSDTRLKAILQEVAVQQTVQSNNAVQEEPGDAQKDSDGTSIRTMSIAGSLRYSLINSPGPGLPNGASLADELNFDDDETDGDAIESVFSSPRHKRAISRDSVPMNRRHRRDLSLESLQRPGSAARSRLFFNPNVLGILQGEDEPTEPRRLHSYTDTGIQFSPPPSPKLVAASKPAASESETVSRLDPEIEANQSRKRVQPSPPQFAKSATAAEDTQRRMVSVAAQTVAIPLSPPRTPKMVELTTPPPEELEAFVSVCAATQTDPVPELPTFTLVPPLTPPVPVIAIPYISVQPPTSRPTTPRSPMLPPYMKNFGCQVNMVYSVPTSESAVQTDVIQVDKRLVTLPLHLQPSAISSRPTSPINEQDARDASFTPVPRNLRRPVLRTEEQQSSPVSMIGGDNDILGAYPRNDNLDSAGNRASRRRGSFFSGFTSISSDAEEFDAADVSDSEYRTALSAPRPPSTSTRPSKRSSFGTATTSPEEAVARSAVRGPAAKLFGLDLFKSLGRSDLNSDSRDYDTKPSKTVDRPAEAAAAAAAAAVTGAGPSRPSDIRKHAMIRGSIASQQTRSRSPSLPDGQNPPPFPIPLRDSSKRLSFAEATSEEQSPTRAGAWPRRGSSRANSRANNVRRVRSAAVMSRVRQQNRRHSSKSPPPLSVSTEAPESPSLPPLPRNDITTPKNKGFSFSRARHRRGLSATTDNTDPISPLQTSPQATSVVDAIAQTMVGEWMFKYVRRRKPFNVPDSASKEETGNDRHKRWVWLAPYERSILWSSKQPSSGSALMGKTGRKLTIQSVLDVKDDNPVPKGAQTIFNRSILILTPQRALKFTANSSERHYIWLAALSFLAHSPQAVPENLSAPQPQIIKQAHQQSLPTFDVPHLKPRRAGIRDSIRLAKNKTATTTNNNNSNNKFGPRSVPSTASLQRGDVSFCLPISSIGSSHGHNREASHDTAEPPMIERFGERMKYISAHGRQRSNTGVQQHYMAPPLSFRGFSGPVDGVLDHSAASTPASSSEIFRSPPTSNMAWGSSQRTSEASSRQGNFFDAIGTVCMEAFISPLVSSHIPGTSELDGLRGYARRHSKEHRRRSRSRSRNFDSFNYFRRGNSRRGYDDYYGGSRTAGEEDYTRDDLFKGF